ncbi:MAG: imelysin family protein [Pseudomonadota bacterium]
MNGAKSAHIGMHFLALGGLWLALSTAGPASAAPADFKHRQLADIALQKFILPGYEHLDHRLKALRFSVDALCKAPTSKQLQLSRKAYRESISAWGKIEFIRFGPVTRENRYERIFYWPDRKGRGRRQVLRLLSAQDDGALKPGNLAKKSVAVQGLTALELVLFGKASGELAQGNPNSFACRYGVAIIDNLQDINLALLTELQPNGDFEKTWRSPGPQNPVYLEPSEISLELVKALDHGLENLRDRRIAPVLGFGKNRRRKSRPVLWRSKTSMILIHANIQGLYRLLFSGGLADAYIASRPYNGERAEDLMDSIRSEFELTLGMSGKLADETDPFAGKDILSRLVPIGFPLRNIRHNAVTEIKAAAGLAIGFNASDGD